MTTLPPDPNSLYDGLVEVVNPNGLKGRVAPTSIAAQVYKQPPSAAADEQHLEPPAVVDETTPVNLRPALEQPARNGSTEEWREYATNPLNPQALSSDEADQMSRDELVAHFTSEED